MTDETPNSDYLVARFFIALLLLIAVVTFGWILSEFRSGVSQHWANLTARANDPTGFWIDIGFQSLIALLCIWQAYRLRRFARRKTN